jgi:uncharacterized protein (DUF362 family)
MTMEPLTRAEFLKLAGVTAAGVALVGADQLLPPGDRVEDLIDPAIAEAATYPYLTVARHKGTAVASSATIAALTRKSVNALGGMKRFVHTGNKVVIKPNIAHNIGVTYAANTNPVVAATLVHMCREAGAASVHVMDRPIGATSPTKTYANSGIKKAVEAAGGHMIIMSNSGFSTYKLPAGSGFASWPIYREIINADVVINVPIAKVHGSTRLSLGGKNMMGAILNANKLHTHLSQGISGVTKVVRPNLTVIDAIRILVSHGPGGGSLSDVRVKNTVIASPDIVAADSQAATLFGLKGTQIPYVVTMGKMGLGTTNLTGKVKVYYV